MNKIQKGFTLVELIIVIAVIGILAGTVIVNVGGVREGANTQSAISEIVQARTLIEDSYNPDTGTYGANIGAIDEFTGLDATIQGRSSVASNQTSYSAGTTRPGDWAYAVVLLNDDSQNHIYCIDSEGSNDWVTTPAAGAAGADDASNGINADNECT